MRSKRFTFAVTFLLLTLFCHASAYALGFGVRANYWLPAFDGKLQVDHEGVEGTEIKLKDDLDIKNDNIPFVEGYVGVGDHELTFMYAYVNCTGEKTISKDMVFDGNVFYANARVDSSFKANIFDLEYQYKLVNFNAILAGVSLGLLLRVKYIDGEVNLYSNTAGSNNDIKENLNLPIPMVGGAVKLGILANILEARVKGAGMAYSGHYFYDVMGDVALTPFPFINIHGGYRMMSFKIDGISDIYASMTFHGPYVGVKVGF